MGKKRTKGGNEGDGSGRIGRPGLDRAKYEEILVAWRECQNVSKVAERCQLARKTVRKYLVEGDPERDMPPIKERVAAITKRAQDMADDHRAAQDIEMVLLVREGKRHAYEELKRRVDDPKRWGKEQMGSLLTALHKIEQDLGGAEGQYVDPLGDLDDVDLMAFWKLGLEAAERYGFGAANDDDDEGPELRAVDWTPPGGPVEDEAKVSAGGGA